MSKTARTVHALQDISKLFDDELYPQAAKAKSEVDRALDGLREGEQAKLVSWLGSRAVRQKFGAIGIHRYDYGVGGYCVLIGSEEAWQQSYRLRLRAYYTIAWWQDGRWVEKKREKPKRWPPGFSTWVNQCNARSEDRFDSSPWVEFHAPYVDDEYEEVLEARFERLVANCRTLDGLILRMTYDMGVRFAQIEPGSDVFEDRKTGRQYRVGHFGPIFTPGRDPEPQKAFVYAARPVR